MFEPNSKETFPEREERILAFWQREGIFEASLAQRKGAPRFTFYDGPPFATGLPHYGHILAGTIKDVVPRYKTMQGFYVPRRFGWDCHGLPVENEIEKAKELSGASSIESFGIAAFNEECRSIVLRYTSEWESTVQRMGRFVSFKDTYRTMDPSFMESVWWVFGQLYEKGLIYEGFKVMPFSARLGTPLSNFEANLNYREVDDPSLTVLLPLLDEPGTALLVWTTTPWTLPSNLAVMVKGDLDYVKLKEHKTGRQLILAESRVASYFKDPAEYEILDTFKGTSLAGKRYAPLFPYFAARAQQKAFRIILEDLVSSEEGTGLVHSAPAFGEVDFYACAREGIELVCPIDHNGKFTEDVPDFKGLFVKDADREIIRRLKEEKKVFHHGQIRHRYPFCWRSDTPLIYKAVSTWFVAVEKIKERMCVRNSEIAWVPSHIRDGRFGKWLENARDWAISRNRYWGTPIPLWRSEDGELIAISSIADLEKRVGQKVGDLHRHFIDELTFMHNGKEFRRVKEVFDCWFESGSMPYAQDHYPFENREEVEKSFPADFIAEGLDQTRGWFYTLHVLAVALFDKPAFKNVVVNGIILAEDGAKMSKRLKNYPEPSAVFNRYGADAVRLYLLSSPAVHAEDLRFSERGVELVLRQVLIPFWNAFVFFSTYAKIYNWHPRVRTTPPDAEIDRWILSRLQKLTQDVTGAMDQYALSLAVEPFVGFIDQLTNWYIRRCRGRFWADDASQDRDEAFETLYTTLLTLTRIAAPFIPFLSDAIYAQLKVASDPLSVHLTRFPTYEKGLRDEVLEREMGWVQEVVSLGHSLRKENKMKVRQPLAKAYVISANPEILGALTSKQHLIAEELNVKEVKFEAREEGFVSLSAKANFRVLGKKVGKKMNAANAAILALEQTQLAALMRGDSISLNVEGEAILLTPEDVAVERKVKEGLIAATAGEITIALDTDLTEELLLEGLAREMVNKINSMRRDEGYAVTDRVVIALKATDRIKKALAVHKGLILHEVLGTEIQLECETGTEWDLNGEPTQIAISLSV
ncbi:MAG: isoleucine--tRNA ligase [Verrucomicrobia bacterium]|nr:isoleucine--tRNA ligase [Verrucomicrobiota bacterium]